MLSSWVRDNKCALKDFSEDARFVKLCKILGLSSASAAGGFPDLSIVLNVTAEDQAAKLLDSADLPQMVKVSCTWTSDHLASCWWYSKFDILEQVGCLQILSLLGQRKRRSVAFLRSLSFHMAKSSEVMNIKQAADVLYACATLNYVDEVSVVCGRVEYVEKTAYKYVPFFCCPSLRFF